MAYTTVHDRPHRSTGILAWQGWLPLLIVVAALVVGYVIGSADLVSTGAMTDPNMAP